MKLKLNLIMRNLVTENPNPNILPLILDYLMNKFLDILTNFIEK